MTALLLLPLCLAGQAVDVVPIGPGLDRTTVPLSGFVRVTLAIEGPAPLRVTLPDDPGKLLTPASAAVWRVRPGTATLTSLPEEGREHWECTFRLDPYTAGEKVPLAFAPMKVIAGADLNPREVKWDAKEVRVQTGIAEVKAENARPVTSIEDLPPPVEPPPSADGWLFVALLGSVFAGMVGFALIRRWRAKPPPLPPGVWAMQELNRLTEDLPGHAIADRVAVVLRTYVERKFGLPATKWTTAELALACTATEWPARGTAELREMLEQCDRSKFAGDVPDAAAAAVLVARAKAWVERMEQP